MGSFIIPGSPTLLLLKGIKYVTGFYNIVEKRHLDQTKQFLDKWRSEVDEGYSRDNLKRYFEVKAAVPLQANLEKSSPIIIVNLTLNTIYDLFSPLPLQNILYLLEEDKLSFEYVLFDNLSYFPKFEYFMKFFEYKLASTRRKFSLITGISTKDQVNMKNIEKIMKLFSQYSSVCFDLASEFLSTFTSNQPLS